MWRLIELLAVLAFGCAVAWLLCCALDQWIVMQLFPGRGPYLSADWGIALCLGLALAAGISALCEKK